MSGSIEELASAVCGYDLGEAFCLTVVTPDRPWSLEEVVTRLGGRLDDVRAGLAGPEAAEQVYAESAERYAADVYDPVATYLISEQAGCWVLVELNGFQGDRTEVQRVLSRGASVHTQFEGMSAARFVHSRDGVELVAFDPVHPEGRYGAEPEVLGEDLQPVLAAVRSPDGSLREAVVGLLLRRTGVVLDQAWWLGEHQVLIAPELPADPPAPPTPLEAALAAAPRDQVGTVLLHAVRVAALATGIADDVPPNRALDALEAALAEPPGRARAARLDRAVIEFLPYGQAQDEAFSPPGTGDLVLREGRGRPGAPPMEEDPVWHRMQAGSALHQLLIWAMDRESGWPGSDEVLVHVRLAIQGAWDALEAELVRRLTPN